MDIWITVIIPSLTVIVSILTSNWIAFYFTARKQHDYEKKSKSYEVYVSKKIDVYTELFYKISEVKDFIDFMYFPGGEFKSEEALENYCRNHGYPPEKISDTVSVFFSIADVNKKIWKYNFEINNGKFYEIFYEFDKYFNKNKFFLSAEIIVQIESYLSKQRTLVSGLWVMSITEEPDSFDEVYNESKELNIIKEKLVQEFRKEFDK
jgi:hypothetical protein